MGDIKLTNAGIQLLNKVQAGIKLEFTKFAVGDGEIGNNYIPSLTALIKQLYTYPVNRLVIQSANTISVGFGLNNENVKSGFYFREVGLFARDPDLGEILYAYQNFGTGAGYIEAGGGNTILEEQFNILSTVGDSSTTTAIMDKSIIYVTYEELETTLKASKKYTDDQIGSIKDASITQKGIVQLTNNTGTSEVLATTQKGFTTHVNDTVKHITQDQRNYWDGKQARLEDVDAIELGGSRTKNGVAYIDFHTTAGSDFDGRILVGSGNQRMEIIAQNDIVVTTQGQTFSLIDLKQSGVDRKNELVYWLNANSVSASVNEDMSALINKLGTVANRRYKEGYTQTSQASASADVIWIFPGGFYEKLRTEGYQYEAPTSLVSIAVDSGQSVDVYARDNVGREILMGSLSGSRNILYYAIATVTIDPSRIIMTGYRGAGGTNNPIYWSKDVTDGFNTRGEVRFVFVKRNYSSSSGFPRVDAKQTLVFGG